ncbi:hypothetical protein PG985_001479 [Apiospora marii]|uniref:Uncharacterized protein n=1 Tax=Apiospora marii TaxID=335849 RepID=A0ABR1RI19_9PEZI
MAITTNTPAQQRRQGPTEVWTPRLSPLDGGLRGRFGKEGTNTKPSPTARPVKTEICKQDGYPVVAPDDMYRMEDELHPGRREPQFPGLHNLHDSVIDRTREPPSLREIMADPTKRRRAAIWDQVSYAVRAALQEIPHGSHVAVVSNSGAKTGQLADQLEESPPGAMIPGATVGLIFVAEFRDERSGIHPNWRQIACPIRAHEGRLMAGLRLLPAVVSTRPDLTFTVTNLTYPTILPRYRDLVHDAWKQGLLRHGSVLNSWKPTNLGCFFHPGGLWSDDYETVMRSFACDGDLYGWDEAVVYTREPVVVIAPSVGEKPRRRFNYWYEGTVLRDVLWLQLKEGRLYGERVAETRRADVVRWDEHGIPGSYLTS